MVPARTLQIETSVGCSYDSFGGGESRLASFPTAVRLGVARSVELRVGSGLLGVDADAPEGEDTVHSTDAFAGIKLQAMANERWKPNLGFVVDALLPSGGGPFTSDVVVPDVRAAASWALPRGLGALVNLGLDVPRDGDGRFARVVYVANASYAPQGLDGRLTLFAEAFGREPVSGDRSAVAQIDLGGAYLIADDWQVDVFTQHGLEGAPDFQLAAGMSTRW